MMRLVVFEIRERQSTELAVTHVEDSEVDFWALPLLVHTGVLHYSGVCCVFLATRLADVTMNVYGRKIKD